MSDSHTGIGTANGKIILMGEHAVVYHQPAIAIPFPATQIRVTITKAPHNEILIDCNFYSGIIEAMPELLTSLKVTIEETRNRLDQADKGLEIHIESTIPPERGMGSSAAVAVATIRALYSYYDAPLTSTTLLELVDISEKITHGNPSGLDALMTSSSCPYYYIKGEDFVPLDLNMEATLIVADTGITGKTKETVGHVASLLETDSNNRYKSIIEALGHLVNESRFAIENNQPNQLGNNMNDAHTYLKQLDVSCKGLDDLVEVSLSNGALGAKMTGGGRGGCMIALASSEEKAEQIELELRKAGAVSTWHYKMEAN